MKNTKDIKILIGAQSWAYGPAGKASAISHELKKRGIILDFIGNNTSFDFCRNTDHFNQFFHIRTIDDYSKFDVSKYNAVISVMDPFLSLTAKKCGIPAFYADSMSRFWIWKNSNKIVKIFKDLKRYDLKYSLKKINNLDPDDRQLIGHLFSDYIFTQGTPQFIPETKNKIKNIGSIIDLSFIKNRKRDTILVSLSGGISPATNLDSAIKYAELVIDLISDSIEKFTSSKRFVITGHPEVIDKIDKKGSLFQFVAMNHEQFLKELNRAIVVLAPCGFTTIFESLAYKTPIIFLPDNHNGHVYEYLIISENIKKNRELIFPNLLFTLGESDLSNIRQIDDSMKIIKKYTKMYFTDISFCKEYKQKFNKLINNFDNKNLVDLQIKAIKNFIPDFGGAGKIASEVLLNIEKYEKHN